MGSLSRSKRAGWGLALAIMLATCGIGAASAAAALPEYAPLTKNAFNLPGTEVTIEQNGGLTGIHCKKASGGIELLNVKEFQGSVVLNECTALLAGSCSTVGAAKGEIVAHGVRMRLAYISKATKEVGLVMNYKASGEAATLFSFGCEKALTKATVRGPVIARLTPINKFTLAFTLGLSGSSGLQEVTQYENESGVKVTASPEMTINGGAFKPADVSASTLQLQGIFESEIAA